MSEEKKYRRLADGLRTNISEAARPAAVSNLLTPHHNFEHRLLEAIARIEAKLDGITALLDVVSSMLANTMEGLSMADIADLADELEALVQEHLEAGVNREDIKATLAAKLQELQDEDSTGENAEDGEEEDEDNRP